MTALLALAVILLAIVTIVLLLTAPVVGIAGFAVLLAVGAIVSARNRRRFRQVPLDQRRAGDPDHERGNPATRASGVFSWMRRPF